MIYRETMRLKLLLAEYKKTWVISTIGIVLYAFGIAVLNTNEGIEVYREHKRTLLHCILTARSFNHRRALDGALADAVSIKDENYHTSEKSENYEGKLIHLHGTLRVQEVSSREFICSVCNENANFRS